MAGLVLAFLFWVGSSLGVEGEGLAAPIGPSAAAGEWSRLYYSDAKWSLATYEETSGEQKSTEKARKQPAPMGSCDDLSVLVDRSHPLPAGYTPKDLVPLQGYGVATLDSEALRREAAEHLGRLVEGATADGQELVVASAYRSYEEQRLSHERLVGLFGAGAARLSAEPGHSQHQLGTAVDFTNAAAGYQVWLPFARTSAYRWLEHHAREYGFVQAYPRGEEGQTGYRWEPWHYRYVGVEDAKRIEEGDLNLQEFLERAGTTPHC